MCLLAAKAKNEKLDQCVHDGVATQSCGCLSLNSVLTCTPIFFFFFCTEKRVFLAKRGSGVAGLDALNTAR